MFSINVDQPDDLTIFVKKLLGKYPKNIVKHKQSSKKLAEILILLTQFHPV